jgi:hypothetical protein
MAAAAREAGVFLIIRISMRASVAAVKRGLSARLQARIAPPIQHRSQAKFLMRMLWSFSLTA